MQSFLKKNNYSIRLVGSVIILQKYQNNMFVLLFLILVAC